MSKHLKNLLDGMSQVLVLDPSTEYVKPSKKDFTSDADILRKDAKQVGNYLKVIIRRHGKINIR